jgi:LPS O-antigen subunit length determinant protein (WzzB/FepE family)
MEAKESELVDYLMVLWKRKWTIILGTILIIVGAGAVSFIITPAYEIDAIIQPGKFFIENQAGNFEEVVVENPQQIADKVIHKSYDASVTTILGLDEEGLPTINAQRIKNTLLTRIWVVNHDIELSKKILDSLITLLRKDIDKKIDIEMNNIETEIKSFQIEKERRGEEIGILKKKISIIDTRKKDIIKEIESLRSRIDELEEEQLKVLKKEEKSEIESLAMLLYSNEVQQSLRYYDDLNEKLSEEKLKEADANAYIQIHTAEINNLDNKIANMEEIKGRIDYTKIVKEPTSTLDPVYPKKALYMLIACIAGLIIFTSFALLLEFMKRSKAD